MSFTYAGIVGTPFQEYIRDQLKVRSNEIQGKPDKHSSFTHQAWIRMISSVEKVDDNINIIPWNKYILGGGIVSNEDLIRFGVQKNASYIHDKNQGFKPMPGIVSADITTAGVIGSLRVANVKIKVWSKSEFDKVDSLFFRLGFSCFLEWGHSLYYSSKNTNGSVIYNKTIPLSSTLVSENFTQTIDNDPISKINSELINIRKDTEGNQDGMIGLITNYSWAYGNDGGYDCNVTITGLGSLKDSINISNYGGDKNIRVSPKYKKIIDDQPNLYNRYYPKFCENNLLNFNTNSEIPEIIEQGKKVPVNLTDLKSIKDNVTIIYWPEEDEKLKLAITLYEGWASDKPIFNEWNTHKVIPALKVLESYIVKKAAFFSGINKPLPEYHKIIDYINSKIGFNELDIQGQGNIFINALTMLLLTSHKDLTSFNIWYLPKNKDVMSDGCNCNGFIDPLSKIYPNDNKRYVSVQGEEEWILITANSESEWNKEYADRLAHARYSLTSGKNFALYLKDVDQTYSLIRGDKEIPKNYELIGMSSLKELNKDIIQYLVPIISKYPDVNFKIEKVSNTQISVQIPGNTKDLAKVQQDLLNPPDSIEWIKPTSFDITTIIKFDYKLKIEESVNAPSSNSDDSESKSEPIDEINKPYIKSIMDYLHGVIMDPVYSQISIEDAYATIFSLKNTPSQFFKYGYSTEYLLRDNREEAVLVPECNIEKLKQSHKILRFRNYSGDTSITQDQVYIPLGILLMIINNSCLIYSDNLQNKKPILYIDFNTETNFYLTTPYHYSVDPNVCVLPNQYQLGKLEGLYENVITSQSFSSFIDEFKSSNILPENPASDFENGGASSITGKLMYVLVNVQEVNRVFDSCKTDDSIVNLGKFLKTLMDRISSATGNVNKFSIHYFDNTNTIKIIDTQQIPNPGGKNIGDPEPNEIYKFNINTKNSIAKNVSLKTSITSRMHSMLAISAQSGNYGQGGYDGSSFGYTNSKVRDRLKPKILSPIGDVNSKSNNINDNVKTIIINIAKMYGKWPTGDPIIATDNNLVSAYSFIMNNCKGNDPVLKGRDIIPIAISITTDGIAGIEPFQGFSINSSQPILPERFYDGTEPLLNWVVSKITHTIEPSKWDTSIEGLMINKITKNKYNKDYSNIEAPNIIISKASNRDPAITHNGDSKVGKGYYETSPLVKNISKIVQNGYVDSKLLTNISGKNISANEPFLHPDAARKWLAWRKELDTSGVKYNISSAYRSINEQQRVFDQYGGKEGGVAKKGHSPHGWGGALDFGNLYGLVKNSMKANPEANKAARLNPDKNPDGSGKYPNYSINIYEYLVSTGKKYGWYNPWRLSDSSGVDEIWHFEYWGPIS